MLEEIKPTGIKFEHILLSVTVAHTRGIGQFDDTCARHVEKGMEGYHGVLRTDARVQYRHCTVDHHPEGCTCDLCEMVTPLPGAEESVSPTRELMLALEHLRFACEHNGLQIAAGVGTRVLAKYQHLLPDFQTDAYWADVNSLGTNGP